MKKFFKIFLIIVCLVMLSSVLLVVNNKLDGIGSFGKDDSDTSDPLGTDIGIPEKTYTVQGKYCFNEYIFESKSTIIQSVNFTSNGKQFNAMFYDFEDDGKLYYLSNSAALAVYDVVNNESGWNYTDSGYQIVDFGVTPQKVTKEFYEWIMRYSDIYSPPVGTTFLSGVWELNEKLTFTNASTTIYYCNYTSNNFTGNAIEFTHSSTNKTYSMSYLNEAENKAKLVYTVSGTWDSEAYRTIDFGTTPMIVSEKFYDWLLVNAKPADGSSVTPQQYTVSGTYTFVESPTVSSFNEYVEFSLNLGGELMEFGNIYITDNRLCFDSYTAFDYSEEIWSSVDFRTIDFGSTPQIVSEEFYTWLMMNVNLGGGSADVHQHTVINIPAIAVTCTEDGFTAGSYCSACNEVFLARTVIKKLGHTAGEWITIKAATETETGLRVKRCIRCSIEISREDIPMLTPQQYTLSGKWILNEWLQVPDNEQQFWTPSFVCDGVEYDHMYVNQEGNHTIIYSVDDTAIDYTEVYLFDGAGWLVEDVYRTVDFGTTPQITTVEFYEWFISNASPVTSSPEVHEHIVTAGLAVEPTCTTVGKTAGNYCSECGYVLVAQQDIPALGHITVIDSAVAATCTASGKTEGSHCSRCNAVLSAQQIVGALGHTAGDWIELQAATESEGGILVKRCIRCSTEMARDNTPSLIPQQYTVSGTYTFVESPTVSSFNEYVEFSLNLGGELMEFGNIYITDNRLCFDSYTAFDYSEEIWSSVDFRTVDFGSTSQTVSKEFYEWLIANAS